MDYPTLYGLSIRQCCHLILISVISLVLIPLATADVTDLRINELVADNNATIADESNQYDDWFEIINTGSTQVNLEGLYLTDNPDLPTFWECPDTVLSPGCYLIFWADDDAEQGPLHTTFKLSASGEFLGLYQSLGGGNGVIDSTSFNHQWTDVSFGRYPDGAGEFGYMSLVTPGLANAPIMNMPPFIENTTHIPAFPKGGDIVTVTSTVFDDGQLSSVTLYYSTGGGYLSSLMYDDGAHGDQNPGDGIFAASIPGQLEDTYVTYYIEAIDIALETTTDPETAPAEVFAYEVGPYLPPPLFINEFMASNSTTVTDEAGEFDDWLEIYNNGAEDLNLAGYQLTDDAGEPALFTFPDITIAAGGFLLVWCDNDPEQGPLHTEFKLSASGEFVGLYDRADHASMAIDTLTFTAQTTDISQGRSTNGGEEWVFFTTPTPGASNQSGSVFDWESPDSRLEGIRVGTIVRNRIDIRFTQALSGPVNLELFDLAGRCLKQTSTEYTGAGESISVSTRLLPAGSYLLRLQADGQVATSKLILVR